MHLRTWMFLALCTAFTGGRAHATVMNGAWYELRTDHKVTVVHSNNPWQEGAATDGQTVVLPAGLELSVEETALDPTLGLLAHLNVDSEGEVPSDFWISYSELEALDLDYQMLPEELGMLKKGMTYCYRDVKKTAVRMGICPHYPSGSEAWMGYKIMQRECGMHPVRYSTRLKIGAVCFSTGQHLCGPKHKCGHVMIKIARHKWFGAGVRQTPWVGKLTGCLVK